VSAVNAFVAFRPAGVEAKMRQRLADLRAGQTAVDSPTQVHVDLVIVAHGG
jgi:hypothetical protein